MSRIGKAPITVPAGVDVKIDGRTISVKGPKGTLEREIPGTITISQDGDTLTCERPNDENRTKAMHGLTRSLVNNMVIGVTRGFERKLTIVGVGYRAEVNGKLLVLNLGYAEPVEYPIPEAIGIEVEASTRLTVSGASKQQVGQVSAEIRSLRPPEPYKGKGIRYENEIVHIKPGKTGVA